MKRLAFLLAMLPSLAFAQVGPEVYKIATPAQIMSYTASSSQNLTAAILSRIVRLTCTTDCFVWINATGQSFPASTATGVFLPADTPTPFSVSPNSNVKVIRDASDGVLHVQELTK